KRPSPSGCCGTNAFGLGILAAEEGLGGGIFGGLDSYFQPRPTLPREGLLVVVGGFELRLKLGRDDGPAGIAPDLITGVSGAAGMVCTGARSASNQIHPAVTRLVCVQVEQISRVRSEEHTSELQSRENLVCRLLREKEK